MAREDFSERELPSVEVRRQILKRAGTVLDEARDLLAQLDQHEAAYPRSPQENQQVLERAANSQEVIALQAPPPIAAPLSKRPSPPGRALAA